MSKNKNISVAHLWSDFVLYADGNPQHFLKKKNFPSITLTASLIHLGEDIPNDIFYYSKKENPKNKIQSYYYRIKNKITRNFFWINVNSWALNVLKNKNITILHAHFGYTAVRYLNLVKKLKLPLIVTFYGVDGSSFLIDPSWVKKYQEMFKFASKLIVLSEIVKERLVAIGCPEEKIQIWNIPIKLDVYQYQKRISNPIIKFITAARFVEKKGHTYLLAAFNQVHQQYPNTQLTIIGYGNEKYKIEADVAKYQLEKVVTIIDTKLKTDFPTLYYTLLGESHIFVLPSTTSKTGDDEGGPSLTLVSAQAAGLPVICTPFAGSEVSVMDNINGLLCKQDNVESLTEKMIYLMNNPQLWETFGKAGSEFVHQHFSEETQMKQLLEIYKKI